MVRGETHLEEEGGATLGELSEYLRIPAREVFGIEELASSISCTTGCSSRTTDVALEEVEGGWGLLERALSGSAADELEAPRGG